MHSIIHIYLFCLSSNKTINAEYDTKSELSTKNARSNFCDRQTKSKLLKFNEKIFHVFGE